MDSVEAGYPQQAQPVGTSDSVPHWPTRNPPTAAPLPGGRRPPTLTGAVRGRPGQPSYLRARGGQRRRALDIGLRRDWVRRRAPARQGRWSRRRRWHAMPYRGAAARRTAAVPSVAPASPRWADGPRCAGAGVPERRRAPPCSSDVPVPAPSSSPLCAVRPRGA